MIHEPLLYTAEDNGYVGQDGITYNTLTDLLQCGVLQFCGCGSPQENLRWILNGLSCIDNQWKDKRPYDQQLPDIQEKTTTVFGNQWAQNFFFYWCDKEEYTKHGVSIPGQLTKKGQILLNALQIACSEEI